jgi:hypothetical protein
VTVVEAKKFRPEAEGKCVNFNAAPAADHKMSELMKENDKAQDEYERHNVSHDRPNIHEDWNLIS